jgi:aryl-alcohol dehydrogenase-like predicted oxidoreductase
MKTIILGKTGIDVSVACLGTMWFGTKTDEKTSYEILDMYVETGGNFLDTANVYSAWEPNCKGGESEELLGRWMRDRGNREQLILATKVGSRWQSSGFGLKSQQIEKECEASLKRLGVDTIDLYYAHLDDYETPVEETMAAFEKLIKAGKVRVLGASNFRAWRLERARVACETNSWPFYCCVQQRLSYLQPAIGAKFGLQVAANEDLLEYCQTQQLTLLAYSPLLGGCYTREDKPLKKQYLNAYNEERLEILKALAAEKSISPNQLVFAWMLHSDPLVIPLVAASTSEQMRENLDALNVTLSAEQMERLNNAGA